MCVVCGCGDNEATIEGSGHHPDHGRDHNHQHGHEHVLPDGTVIRHTHDHVPVVHAGSTSEAAGGQDTSQTRLLQVEQDILAKNDTFAVVNRQLFAARGTFTLNLMSSPGSGKTTLLARTLTDLKGRFPVAVIEGDQQTSFDADRIRATGAPAIQINTGKGCHLDAQMVTQALGAQPAPEDGVLFIENVGNLVCPAGFDLGEARKVVVLSVTEGEDKPLKYPNMFAAADLLLIAKVDLLPHLSFDVERMVTYARQLKPTLKILQVSAISGQGLDAWYGWIQTGLADARQSRRDHVLRRGT